MIKFKLRGIAEGLTGESEVTADCPEDVFALFPVLETVKDKVLVNGEIITGFNACDG